MSELDMGSIAIASRAARHGLFAATRQLPVLLPLLLTMLAEGVPLPPQTTPSPEASARLRAAAIRPAATGVGLRGVEQRRHQGAVAGLPTQNSGDDSSLSYRPG